MLICKIVDKYSAMLGLTGLFVPRGVEVFPPSLIVFSSSLILIVLCYHSMNGWLVTEIHKDKQSNILSNIIHVNLKQRMTPINIIPGCYKNNFPFSYFTRTSFQLCRITQMLLIFTLGKNHMMWPVQLLVSSPFNFK